jgi:ubiquinol-cytochrome c reductase cytochrome b subunit
MLVWNFLTTTNDFADFPGLANRYRAAATTVNRVLPFAGWAGLPASRPRTTVEQTSALFYEHLVYYPTPAHIHYAWGFGSLAGVFLGLQLVTGILLVMFYKPAAEMAFEAVVHLMVDVPYGWLLRYAHANGASFFFIVVYCHIGRGLYYGSYLAPRTWTWLTGLLIFFLIMGTAFIGYVLPWGQMSFWGATVITNLLSAIPAVGPAVVEWIWGGFAVGDATLNRFFSLHYLLPFVTVALILVHLYALHGVGSNNPTGLGALHDNAKIPFAPYFAVKDVAGFLLMLVPYCFFVFFEPDLLGHPDNYIPADSLVTPAHIVPEWYFLPFYAILRAIPSKLGGVLLMVGAIVIVGALTFLPLFKTLAGEGELRRPLTILTVSRNYFLFFLYNFLLLGWLGGQPVESPYVELALAATASYFAWFLVFPLMATLEAKFLQAGLRASQAVQLVSLRALLTQPITVYVRGWHNDLYRADLDQPPFIWQLRQLAAARRDS